MRVGSSATRRYIASPCPAALPVRHCRSRMKAPRYVIRRSKKEIDRVSASARRLATWGRVYDNEDLARKAKQMEKQVARLKDEQTELSVGPPWRLVLQGTPCRPTAFWRWTPFPSRPRRVSHPSSPPAWRACAAAIAWPSWDVMAAANRPCCACCGSR